ncbi:hypothetical protein A3766_02430 [Oleiphilus sp. HI0132]|uniref:N-acetylmuramate alpha-1-phosphate uridylyltransferase MurU n=1 Tax=Oleiphilus sp. HI0132 TaxID=1822270 RepID=UPI0007C2A589|nr:nucleotidyltransferase family protein [Oleiphilus sp. HI0132]KZZ76430.1 hypothetical protein A3766_02430 [Oleiphilus sp. HI0132]
MKAMILAAGLGKRMRPLTEHVPKPLLRIGEKYLIEFHLEKLAAAGIQDVVINTHWLAQQIPASLGNGEKWGLRIHYSHESELLETAGGIVQALSMLTDEAEPEFLLINGDVYSELNIAEFLNNASTHNESREAYLALVDNPEHNLKGDFVLQSSGKLSANTNDGKHLTYAGIALFHRDFFKDIKPGPSQLGPQLRTAIEAQRVGGERIQSYWLDVGTPGRLQTLRDRVSA